MNSPRELLSRYLPKTPLIAAPALGPRVYAKLETGLPTGSFKVRGALYALVVNQQRRPITEVVASSTGNHGAAVAWAARRLGLRATIFLPHRPNPVKRALIAEAGATVVEAGEDLAGAYEAALAFERERGAFFLNDATDPDLPAGPGTISDEILEDLPAVETIYVPVGDTALIRGVAARAKELKPSIRIVGVQAERAPSYYLSWKSGVATPTASADTIADGLATRTPVAANVAAIRALVDDMRLVSEGSMIRAVERLREAAGIVAEPSAASTLAACLAAGDESTVVLLITGRNSRTENSRSRVETRDLRSQGGWAGF